MKFSIKTFFGKSDQIRRKLLIWSHLLKKSLMENFILVQYEISLFQHITKNEPGISCEKNNETMLSAAVQGNEPVSVLFHEYHLNY